MKSGDLKRQIESMQNSLRKASASLPSYDPALSEFKRIVQRKIEEADCVEGEEIAGSADCILFADEEELEERSPWRYAGSRFR